MRILCVDDDAIIRKTNHKALGNNFPDFIIEVADDGVTGSERYCDKTQPRVDIIVTDVNMKIVNGDVFIKGIRATPDIVQPIVIFSTGRNDEEEGRLTGDPYHAGFISKDKRAKTEQDLAECIKEELIKLLARMDAGTYPYPEHRDTIEMVLATEISRVRSTPTSPATSPAFASRVVAGGASAGAGCGSPDMGRPPEPARRKSRLSVEALMEGMVLGDAAVAEGTDAVAAPVSTFREGDKPPTHLVLGQVAITDAAMVALRLPQHGV